MDGDALGAVRERGNVSSVRVLGLDMLRCLPPYIPPGMPPGEGFGFLGLVSVVRVRISLRFKGQGVSVYKARVP